MSNYETFMKVLKREAEFGNQFAAEMLERQKIKNNTAGVFAASESPPLAPPAVSEICVEAGVTARPASTGFWNDDEIEHEEMEFSQL